jgi:hypothetical protein
MQHRLIRWGLGLALLVLSVGLSQAQTTGPNDSCRHARANRSAAVPRQDIAIDTTAVTVIVANGLLCGGIIQNTSPTQALRCAAISDGAPTAVEGFRVPPGSTLMLGLEAQPGWACVRDTTATSAGSVSIVELFQ